jgi:prevent-host-death family protein
MKRKPFKYPPHTPAKLTALRESALAEPPPVSHINIRAAKDQLSSLLEEAAKGNEIIITSDGLPKAKLGPMNMKRNRFHVDWELLRSMPVTPGPTAEAILREERDGRP